MLDFRLGLPADLVIKSGNKDIIQPLDYSGLPFRCFRCHGLGYLANDCSLSFKKHSFHKIWRVKKDWNQSNVKTGIPVNETLDICLDEVQSNAKGGNSIFENPGDHGFSHDNEEIQSIAKVGNSIGEHLDVLGFPIGFDPLAKAGIPVNETLDKCFDETQPSAKNGISVDAHLDVIGVSYGCDVIQPWAKVGNSVDENLDALGSPLCLDPLANLKQISLSNLDDNFFLNPTLEDSFPNTSLKDLGFVSPCKAVVSKGYFLRSSSKSVQENYRPVRDKFRTLEYEEGLTDGNLLGQAVFKGDGALRESALYQVPL